MKNTQHLRDWLFAEAAERDLSHSALARDVGISEGSMSRLLSGTTVELRARTIELICRWADTTPYQLMDIADGGKGQHSPEQLMEARGVYRDKPARIADWLCTGAPPQIKKIIYTLASEYGVK